MYGDIMTNLFISLFVLLIIFLITRELWMWYWKINKIVSLLESINEKLNGQDPPAESTGTQASSVVPEAVIIPLRPDAPQEILIRYQEMEDRILRVRYRDREQYSAVERSVIEWQYIERGLEQA